MTRPHPNGETERFAIRPCSMKHSFALLPVPFSGVGDGLDFIDIDAMRSSSALTGC